MAYDYSTLDLTELRKLPVAKLAHTYHLQDSPGNGCFGDPPGYPTYFTRAVYTRHGNSPARGAQLVITDPEDHSKHYVLVTADHTNDWYNNGGQAKLFKRLYRPLPLEHPRVQTWISRTLTHFQNCYLDVGRPENGRPAAIIYPVPSYKLRHFTDDPRWNDEYRAAARAEVDAFNQQERDRAANIASVSTHQGVRVIREFYPDYRPAQLDEMFLPVVPERSMDGDWWERHADRPTPETCPGLPYRGLGWGTPGHRVGGWCQFCGHVSELQPDGSARYVS